MINFRKLKQDFSPATLKEGRLLYEKELVVAGKIISLDAQSVRLNCRVSGNFNNSYQSIIEINSQASSIIDSDCDCPHKYDCQHIAAALYYLEENFNEIFLTYSKETGLKEVSGKTDHEKEALREAVKQAEHREVVRKGKKYQREVLQEYVGAAQVLGQSPFFIPEENLVPDKADLFLIVLPNTTNEVRNQHEIRLALRLPYRSKPLNVLCIREFLEAVRYQEPLYIGSKRFYFVQASFGAESLQILKVLLNHARFPDPKGERNPSIALIDTEIFGMILAHAYENAMAKAMTSGSSTHATEEHPSFSCLYFATLEEPLKFAMPQAGLQFQIEYLEVPAPKLLLKPQLLVEQNQILPLQEVLLFECAKPGLIHKNIYYRFQHGIKRKHLRDLSLIRDVTIPEPLFGTFVENAMPELLRIAHVSNKDPIDRFVTLPYVGDLSAICDINYLDGELEATLHFVYDDITVPAASNQLTFENVAPFVTDHGILARNLTEEQKITNDLFQDFLYHPSTGVYAAKNDKKIVEFMTEVIPRNQCRVQFNCPENLLDQFIYDETEFKLNLRETNQIDSYIVELKVNGHLKGTTLDLLWECLQSKRAFIEIGTKKNAKKKGVAESDCRAHKILVLDLEKLAPVIQIFDELGVNKIDDHAEKRPLWSLASISADQFEGLPIEFEMSDALAEIQEQMLGTKPLVAGPIPKTIKASLRSYQQEGVEWLDRLRSMRLNGILADDMGLGKTLQAIIAITQLHHKRKDLHSIIVCPTSLIYNWKEEFGKFNPQLRVLPIDGTPSQRKKLLTDLEQYDVVITSYSLLQKDIDIYKQHTFGYAILDEAQQIKNRTTRNAKSVKMIEAHHRLILTGTPIENSLEDLWSLFDFLMPGLLSSYDRFIEKFVRHTTIPQSNSHDVLRKKVSPFILRRMKKDVLEELPPISEIVYHCHLSETQRDLYKSYADSAREELSQLVKKEGFDKVQIQVLATLTRLKQICCHPAIFAKETAETGDSSKYDMLMELLQTLIEGKHKTVIFSQYTRMLNIMREDLQKLGIRFCYLDGSSKNRLEIVKQFNEDDSIIVFLVSLKAGGTGLNLVGADTVIHYDMWWNPAVENQATDRVHRLGQKSSVSSYKLITLGTIEEKILELQNRKKGLVNRVISGEEEAMAKLTWEEVLELLQT